MPQPSGFLVGGSSSGGSSGGGGTPSPLEPRIAALETNPTLPVRVTALEGRVTALEGATPPAVDTPNVADGRPLMQLGLWYLTYWAADNPLIDDSKLNGPYPDPYFFVKPGNVAATVDEIVAADAIDPITHYPRPGSVGPAPAPFERVCLGTFAFNGRYFPDRFNGRWAATWDGVATPEFNGVVPDVVQPNRIEFVINHGAYNPNGPFLTPRIEFVAVGAGFGNLRVFRIADEAKLVAGQIFRDDFLAEVRRYKILRTMDWRPQGAPIRKAAQRTRMTSRAFAPTGPDQQGNRWLNPALARDYSLYGAPLELDFKLAKAADTALWMNAPFTLGMAPAAFAFWDLTIPYQDRFDVGGPAIRAQHATQIASLEWDTYCDAIVAAMVAEDYPLRRRFHLELGNEVWNTAMPFFINTYYFDRIGEALKNGAANQRRFAYGYYSGRLAEAFSGALQRAGRAGQNWKLVLAGQNAAPITTTQAIEGYRQFFTDKTVALQPWLDIAGASASSYYEGALERGGAFANHDGIVDENARRAAVFNEIEAGPAAAALKTADWIISGNAPAGFLNIPNVVANQAGHVAAAQALGVGWIGDYEGGDHEWLGKFWAPPNTANMRSFINEVRYGEQGRRITAAWIAAIETARPNQVIANYAGVGWYPTLQGHAVDSWHDGAYGVVTGRSQALVPKLRPPA